MGQKVHPKGLRLGISAAHDTRWFATKNYKDLLQEDFLIRNYIRERMENAGISKIEIERTANRIKVILNTAKPGMVIGRSGAGVEKLTNEIKNIILKNSPNPKKPSHQEVEVAVHEILNPELDAQLVAENIASQIVKRISHRRAMKQAVQRVLRAGAKGVKVRCSGRLQGAEIARHEGYIFGKIPLHTLRADISYGFAEALTRYGQIGVKVWIYRGDIIPEKKGGTDSNVNAKEG